MAKKKKKEKKAKQTATEKALVKSAAHDLGVKYRKGMTVGTLIQTEAEKIVRQAAASTGIDPDDHLWRGITQSRRDLTPLDQDQMIEIANYLAYRNPLGKKIRETRRDFVIGDGVKFEAEDQKVIQPLIDEFWNDPVNNMEEFEDQIVDALGINGEVFIPTFVNEFSGQVRLGWIDPYEVEQVWPDRHNRRIMRTVAMKPGAGAGFSAYYDLSVKRTYDVINVDTDPRSPTFNHRVGNLFHFKINCAPDATRGRSDFEATADLIDAWDRSTFNDLERMQLVLNFIWDVTLNGKTEPEIQEWLRDQAEPRPGSIRAHNEGVEWKVVAPELKAYETRHVSDGILRDTLGSAGQSLFYTFGITEGANRASSETLEIPILKGFQARQKVIRRIFCSMIDYRIDQAALKRPVLRRQLTNRKISRVFKAVMPELSTRDLSRVGAMLTQTQATLDAMVELGWITNEFAASVMAVVIAQIGVEYDALDEFKKAQKEKQQRDEENEMRDYTPDRIKELQGKDEEGEMVA